MQNNFDKASAKLKRWYYLVVELQSYWFRQNDTWCYLKN